MPIKPRFLGASLDSCFTLEGIERNQYKGVLIFIDNNNGKLFKANRLKT
jgi:hypothetical protein